MVGVIFISLAIIYAVYSAIRTAATKNKDLRRKIEEYNSNVHNKTNQYVWKGYHPVTKQEFEEAFDREGLSKKWKYFEKQLQPEVRLKLQYTPDDYIELGRSKIGGKPDLPKSVRWPIQDNGKHLAFLAQINFSEISNIELGFPNQGMLYFFYSEDQEFWGCSQERANDFRTIFIENIEDIERRSIPSSLTILENRAYLSSKVSFINSYSLPDSEHDFVTDQLKGFDYAPYMDISTSDECITKLGGHSTNIQGTMEYECEMVSRGYHWNNIPENVKQDIKQSQYQWKLLFQLDSESESQMMWGDAGKLYFWIKEEDMKLHQYDKTWMILQSH